MTEVVDSRDARELSEVLITVVVPAYNVQDYLGRCLDSVVSQTHIRIQVVVVDDGSTDETGRICDEFARRDNRITVVHQENGGLSRARNVGLSHAEGDYVFFLDGDDVLAPRCLELLLEAAEASGALLSVCESQVIKPGESPTGENIGDDQVISGTEAARLVVGEGRTSMIVATSKLYRKELWPLLHYPEEKVNEDEFVTYRAMYEAGRVALVRKQLYGYVKRPGSIMSDLGLRSLDALEGLQGAIDFFEERGEHDLAGWARKRYTFHIMACYCRISISKERSDEVLGDLVNLFDTFMATHGDDVMSHADWLLRAQIAVFKRSPSLYVRIASAYLRRS